MLAIPSLPNRDLARDPTRHALRRLAQSRRGLGAVLAAEYLGAQSGLGYIIVYAQQFGLLDRMFLIALLFILYTSASYWVIERLFTRLLAWSPSSQAANP